MLPEELSTLKQKLIEYATLVENMMDKAVNGLLSKQKEKLSEIIKKDELKANEFEIEIENLCTSIIARYNPLAVDLRTVLMVLKINNDLERIADLIVNIAESSSYLIEKPSVKPLIDIPEMFNITKDMLNKSINSFIEKDKNTAIQVCRTDEKVDNLRDQILRELITYMTGDFSVIESSLHLLRISKNLERIADHCTNICEDVVFMIKGRIIKHQIDNLKKNK